MDAEPSLQLVLSGGATAVGASSAPLLEDAGREEPAELRRLPNDSVGNAAGRDEVAVVDAGADRGTVLLVCELPKEKLALLLPKEIPPKPMAPEVPGLGRERLPGAAPEELPEPVLAAGSSAAVGAVAGALTGGPTCFPGAAGPLRVKPEGTLEALLAGSAASSAGPTRSPEKLPRVSPAEGLGHRSSPSLAGAVSSLLEVAGRTVPEAAPGLLFPAAADSPGEELAAPGVLDAEEEFSGMAS